MTTLHPTAASPPGLPVGLRFAPTLYAATMFLSALLLFAVQPMPAWTDDYSNVLGAILRKKLAP